MATTTHTYMLHVISKNLDLKITYRSNRFAKIEKTKGKLTDDVLKAIGKLIPPSVNDVPAFAKAYKDKVTYNEYKRTQSQYTSFNSAWFAFYNDYAGRAPKFTGADANALKQIIVYLNEVSDSPEQSLDVWTAFLTNWTLLSKFHQSNTDLKYINSKLNVLLNELKESNTDTTAIFTRAMESETARDFKFK